MKRPYIERIRQKKKGYYSPPIPAPVLAFPNAKGAGANITGGRGGQIVHVTNLNDSGPGSLRQALQLEYPRIIVFDVSGRIDLQSILPMSKEMGNVTIAGQTAPEGGITISGNIIQLGWGDFCNNVIFRYIRFRNGSYTGVPDVYEHNGVVSTGGEGLIFDHCSFSFCDDQAISLIAKYGNLRNITIQRCIFSENATQIIIGHDETMETGDSTIVDNLFVDISHRTPNLGGRGFKRSDIINNVIFNYGNRLTNLNHNPDARVNNIGNYYKRGSYSGTRHNVVQRYTGQMQTPLIYTARNYDSVLYPTPVNNDTQLWTDFTNYGQALDSAFFTNEMFELVGKKFPIKSALETYDEVLTDVGANKYLNGDGTFGEYSDSFDSLKISNTINNISSDPFNKTWIQPILPNNIRDSNFYNSNPHIPEEWFIANVPVGQDHNDIAPSGYTWIEEYLNQVDKTSALPEPLLAFPGAVGFAKHATGGRGGSVVKVTNLNNSGSGSLRQALQNTPGAKIVVFEVGGTIELDDYIDMKYGDTTVAFQTAPGDGILIKGGAIVISASNVIMRYPRIRNGFTSSSSFPHCIDIVAWNNTHINDIIIDHASLSWTRSDNGKLLNIRTTSPQEGGVAVTNSSVTNVTVQNSILAESNYASLSFGNTFNKTFYNNLFAFTSERNIRTNYPIDDTFDFEMINNMIYACWSATGISYGSKFNVINNVYRNSSQQSLYEHIIDPTITGQGKPAQTHAYIVGNEVPSGYNQYNIGTLGTYIRETPYHQSDLVAKPTASVFNNIYRKVGSNYPSYDSIDESIFTRIDNNTGVVVHANPVVYPTINGGTPLVDSNNDGIPDEWTSNNMPSGATYNDIAPSGYTWIEEYINSII